MNARENWTSAFIGLGANEGDRQANLEKALELIGSEPTTSWRRVSSMRETEPQGGPPQPLYLNSVAELLTCLSPWALLSLLQRVENQLGRVRKVRDGPRPIDLDILTYGDRVIDTDGLVVPHPRICDRSFVLEPLVEIAPDGVHPVTGRSYRELFEELKKGRKRSRRAP